MLLWLPAVEEETPAGATVWQWAWVLGRQGCPQIPSACGKLSSESHKESQPRSALPTWPTLVICIVVMEIWVPSPWG